MVHHRLDQYDPCRVRDAVAIPRAIVAVGASSTSERWEHTPHHHQHGQLIYTLRGVVHCVIEAGIWIVRRNARCGFPAE